MDHIDQTLAIIITLIIVLCVFQCVHYRNVASHRHNETVMKEEKEQFLSYNKLMEQQKRPYKTHDSITRKENGIGFVAGSHRVGLEKMGHRSAAKNMTMETFSSQEENEIIECKNRSPFQPPVKKEFCTTASYNSVI